MAKFKIKQTCSACPSQWEVKLRDGRMVYVRYRYGGLKMVLSARPTDDVCDALYGKIIYQEAIGDYLDGYMTTEEMLPYLEKAIYPVRTIPFSEILRGKIRHFWFVVKQEFLRGWKRIKWQIKRGVARWQR